MAAFDYSRMASTANRLIDRFGRAMAIRRAGVETGPPHDPTFEPPTDHACRGVVLDFDNREIDGTLILATDRRVYLSLAGLEIEPSASDRLVVGTDSLSIERVKPLAPGGIALLYEIHARA